MLLDDGVPLVYPERKYVLVLSDGMVLGVGGIQKHFPLEHSVPAGQFALDEQVLPDKVAMYPLPLQNKHQSYNNFKRDSA